MVVKIATSISCILRLLLWRNEHQNCLKSAIKITISCIWLTIYLKLVQNKLNTFLFSHFYFDVITDHSPFNNQKLKCISLSFHNNLNAASKRHYKRKIALVEFLYVQSLRSRIGLVNLDQRTGDFTNPCFSLH